MRAFFTAIVVVFIAIAASACKEEGTIKVHRLTFKGVKQVDESRLKGALATRQSSRIPRGRKYFFDRTRFDADLKRIQAFYADRGYPDARVVGFDVKLNPKQDAVDLTVTIDEGQPVRIASIDFTGFDVIPPSHLIELEKTAPVKVGQPRDRQLVLTTHGMALNELKDHGYPYGQVATSETTVEGDAHQVSLTFDAQPGKMAHVGSVSIAGNKAVSERVIERELSFKQGDLFSRTTIQESQRRLYGLELFQFATIQPQEQEAQPDDLPMKVTVAEGKLHRLNFGVGYGSEEKARVDAEYHHVNFLGDARSAGAHVRYSSLDRGVRLDFNQPYFFAPHFSLGGEGQDWYTYTPAYRSIVTGAKATLTHRANANTSWSIFLNSEHDNSQVTPGVLSDPLQRTSLIALGLNPLTGEQVGTLNSAGLDFQHSTADNLLNAHHGYELAFHVEQAGKILPGTFNYYAVSGDARHYLPLKDTVTLASRVQLGNLRPGGNSANNVPFSKRFFLGGATSIRGWGRYEVSPLAEGLPIGGDSMFAWSEELRAILHGNLGAVLFMDSGNVWLNSWDIKLGDLRYSMGPGLRYQTPIGPIRVDFGYQLNPTPELLVNGVPQTRRWRVHFSIGQAF